MFISLIPSPKGKFGPSRNVMAVDEVISGDPTMLNQRKLGGAAESTPLGVCASISILFSLHKKQIKIAPPLRCIETYEDYIIFVLGWQAFFDGGQSTLGGELSGNRYTRRSVDEGLEMTSSRALHLQQRAWLSAARLPACLPAGRSVDLPACLLIWSDWVVGWLACLPARWLAGWLSDWLAGWLVVEDQDVSITTTEQGAPSGTRSEETGGNHRGATRRRALHNQSR